MAVAVAVKNNLISNRIISVGRERKGANRFPAPPLHAPLPPTSATGPRAGWVWVRGFLGSKGAGCDEICKLKRVKSNIKYRISITIQAALSVGRLDDPASNDFFMT